MKKKNIYIYIYMISISFVPSYSINNRQEKTWVDRYKSNYEKTTKKERQVLHTRTSIRNPKNVKDLKF